MSRKPDLDLDDEEQSSQKIIRLRKPRPQPAKKQSYEGNADVQRWLQMQALTSETLEKPKFDPTFLTGQRDAAWMLSSLTTFYEEDLITDVLHAVKSGKEASVYCCAAHPATELNYVAAKVYRPRMFRSLRNDAIYRQNRTQHDINGQVVRNSRHHQKSLKSAKGRAVQVSSWIEYEYQVQQLLYAAGAAVPRPLAQMGNAILMEYVGDLGDPAPLLREVQLTREEAEPLFTIVLSNIELFLKYERIHGDLSEYNILYWQGTLKIIDFAQAVDPTLNEGVFPLLLRDIERVCAYFARSGVTADPYALATTMWKQYQGGL